MNKSAAKPDRPMPASLSGGIEREAGRLLALLGTEGAYAIVDPIEEDTLIVRSGGGGGISVGAGRFPGRAGRSLVSADLAEPGMGAHARLTISPAGRARLRRQGADAETRYLAQHLDLTEETGGGEGGRRLRDASESPLAWMARRRGRDGVPLIDPACFEAGERLRRDLTAAMLLPSMSARWGEPRVDGSGPRDPASASDAILSSRQRVRAALDAVGDDLSGLLIDLCGFLKGLERIEAERHWPARSAKVVIRIALSRLAEHYGLEREARGRETGRMRLWRAGP